ncbi:MAG: THAP domain-containing protein [Candidatus Brocadiaceae bacterium]|nr:THAP domain-containing protein [Candidatus Brocadiaceae bacterium]
MSNRQSVFKFPSKKINPELHKAWIRFLNQKDPTISKNVGICWKHFKPTLIKVCNGDYLVLNYC